MNHNAKSIRPFIGSNDFELSRSFYRDLGFKETVISGDMSVFETGNMAFYLQDYYNKDWVDNTMLFMEVDDVARFWDELVTLDLTSKYKNVRIKPIVNLDWGKECFIHDPSGILWHIGEFKTV
ncbi:VOC family protein [Flavobacterium hauense]